MPARRLPPSIWGGEIRARRGRGARQHNLRALPSQAGLVEADWLADRIAQDA